MTFSPIAIVGRACVLPGALDPAALWRLVLDGRTAISEVPAGRWGVDRELMLAAKGAPTADRTVSDRGGFVEGFEQVFDPTGFAVPADELLALDPLCQWLLHTGREALRQARYAGDLRRVGAVLGNLSYPSSSLAGFAESVWLPPAMSSRLKPAKVDPRNRFMSGLPAHLLASALGLGAGAFALDAACASSLYAIKLACDALQEGKADLMLAGAVNRADSLFLHAGFTALGALSPTGQSRPFHAEADGLLPAEGAALVALRRLDDAWRDGNRILGIVRGIGLSNDGRGRGLLVPSEEGQLRALRAAYAAAGIEPASVSLLECHATGTVLGDGVEVAALSRLMEGGPTVPIGSLKSNLGHLITAAGAAALIKVIGAMEEGVRPPSPAIERPLASLASAPLRLIERAEPWDSPDGPRRAGVSAFGFGGNNAHLIVEEPRTRRPHAAPRATSLRPAVAIVAIGARVGAAATTAELAEALFRGRSLITDGAARTTEVTLSMDQLRFPPRDLEETLPQQLLILAAAQEALSQVAPLSAARSGVFVGMQCDAEIARHGARWRSAGWATQLEAPDGWLPKARDGFVPLLGAAGVVGAMPNIVANRLCSQLDLQGMGFAVSAEELSGLRALELARDALGRGELDAALVGAVDLSVEAVQVAAANATLPEGRRVPGDGAAVLVLKRLADALSQGDPVLAVLRDGPGAEGAPLALGDEEGAHALERRWGHAHAASGLLHVVAGALCCAYRAKPRVDEGPLEPWIVEGTRMARVHVQALGGQSATCWLAEGPTGSRGAPAVAIDGSGATPEARFWSLLAAQAFAPKGPRLTFPAHRAPPRLPSLLPAEQTMPPAPALPPIRSRHQERPRLAEVTRARTVSTALTEGHRTLRARVTQVHQEHLAAQAALHQTFLDQRAGAISMLMGFASGARLRTPASAPQARPPQLLKEVEVQRGPRGRSFSREELERHASGRISALFGPAFVGQDEHAIQVRMPQPPLLLADRVTGIDAVAGSMGLGTVWTETDVREDSWYLNRGFMPAGVMIEAGQADLFLISYLGVDALNRGERAYRLLGCELTYHGGLPHPGDTLQYEISIDGHAAQGDVRLFFFHYDCAITGRKALTVREGQAGFFSREELATSAGVLWKPEDQALRPSPRLDAPLVRCTRASFSAEQVRAFSQADLYACFGPGFEAGQAHVRTPSIQPGKMLLFERVERFDSSGGPWGRGYLQVKLPITPDAWFFDGHFKNDPCMPGTLMFEGCLQAMAFYLAGLGHTLTRDGWRFEPVPEEPYRLSCRGQVLPSSRELTCELFVEEVHDGPYPTLYADLLGTVDGLKAFHARRVGLRLVPDWPLSDRPALTRVPTEVDDRPVASSAGFRFDHASLLACAWGKPSAAFGPMYEVFDDVRRVARLPGPPYHFMSRVLRADGEIGRCEPGASVEIAYDVPPDAWYFAANGHPVMPYAVLLEAVLQPCGWLASYVGSALLGNEDLSFRNLDGQGTVHAEVPPGTRELRTVATLRNISRSSGMIIESFEVQCFAGDERVYTLDTVFGFFPKAALENQVGLPTGPQERALFDAPSVRTIDLTERPARYFGESLRLAGEQLLMLDRVTALDLEGGKARLGFLRAEKDVDPGEWFFKAHFFQDPVQPGSLGLEAILQLLQLFMIERGLGEGLHAPRFEPIALQRPMAWKYRGQVVPRDRLITTTLEVTEVGRDERGPFATADASLWVDGKRIYQAAGVSMRIVSAPRAVKSGLPSKDARHFWRSWFGREVAPVEDVYRALLDRFLRRVHLADPARLAEERSRGVLFLANHQTSVESTLFALVGSGLMGAPLVTLAKIENERHWLHQLMRLTFRYPGLRDPEMTVGFDRQDSAALPGIIRGLGQQMASSGRSVMVHVEGTRSLSCRAPVQKVSGTFIDLALELDRPIVPVRFVGGLPGHPLSERAELPFQMGRQDIFLGAPLMPALLRPLTYRERRERVLEGINALGPPNSLETPLDPDPAFAASVQAWCEETGASLGHATVWRLLESLSDPSPEIFSLRTAAQTGALEVPNTAEGEWLAELARRLFGPRGPKVAQRA